MRLRICLIGLGGGILVSIALVYPLVFWVPGLFLSDWPPGNSALSLGCELLGGILLLITGALASRGSGHATRAGGVGAGALAGWMAAMVTNSLLVAPAMGVTGAQTIFLHGLSPAADDIEYLRLLYDAVIGTIGWTTLGLWAASAAGIVLGALGGLFYKPAGAVKDGLQNYALPLAIYAILGGAINYLVSLSMFVVLHDVMLDMASELGFPVTAMLTYMVEIPLITVAIWIALWQLVIWGRMRIEKKELPGRKDLSQATAYLSLLIPLLMIIQAMRQDPAHIVRFHLPVGLALLLAGLPGARIAWGRRKSAHIPADPIPGAARLARFALLLVGTILLSGYVGPIGVALNLVLIPVVSIGCLLPGEACTLPAAVMVQETYRVHAGALGAVAAGYAFYFMTLIWAFVLLRRYWKRYGAKILGRFRPSGGAALSPNDGKPEDRPPG